MNRFYFYTVLTAAALLFVPNLPGQTQKSTGKPAVKSTGMKIKYNPPANTANLNISRAKYDFIERVIKVHMDAGEDIMNNYIH